MAEKHPAMVVLEVSWEALDAAIAKVLTLLALLAHQYQYGRRRCCLVPRRPDDS